jgi:hypothetical protein
MNRLLRALAVVAALAWGVPAHAAVAYVNGDARSGNTSAAVNVTTGNLLVVGTRTNSGYVASVSDTAGNRFIRAFAYNHASQPIELWYARNVTGHASDQVTVSYASGGGFPYLAVAQYSGVSTTTVLDALAWGTGNATSATSSSISTLTANQAIVAFGSSSSGGSSAVAITGYTRRLIDSGNVVALFDNIVSATQSGVTAAAGPWGGANSTVIVATFSETAVPHGITVLSSANSASSQTGTNIAASAYSSVAGNLIVAVVRHANGTISSVTDTAGDTFTRAIGPIGTDPDVELWYAANVAGHSSNAVTANFSASGSFRSIVVTEYEWHDRHLRGLHDDDGESTDRLRRLDQPGRVQHLHDERELHPALVEYRAGALRPHRHHDAVRCDGRDHLHRWERGGVDPGHVQGDERGRRWRRGWDVQRAPAGAMRTAM